MASRNMFTQKNIAGCTLILEAGNVVASGTLVVSSERQAAIYDGSSVQIYSLRNRDIKTVLHKNNK